MKSKEYWEQLNEEYFKPLQENASDEEIQLWFERDREQTKELLSKFGESSWRFNDFANLLRNEDISESFFRTLCRYEMDKCFKKLKDGK